MFVVLATRLWSIYCTRHTAVSCTVVQSQKPTLLGVNPKKLKALHTCDNIVCPPCRPSVNTQVFPRTRPTLTPWPKVGHRVTGWVGRSQCMLGAHHHLVVLARRGLQEQEGTSGEGLSSSSTGVSMVDHAACTGGWVGVFVVAGRGKGLRWCICVAGVAWLHSGFSMQLVCPLSFAVSFPPAHRHTVSTLLLPPEHTTGTVVVGVASMVRTGRVVSPLPPTATRARPATGSSNTERYRDTPLHTWLVVPVVLGACGGLPL